MVEAVPNVFGTSRRAWDVETVGPSVTMLKNRSRKVCAIELKSGVKVPEDEIMGWMSDSRLP
jgi:hypothetical protein